VSTHLVSEPHYNAAMPTRKDLHKLVDSLPED